MFSTKWLHNNRVIFGMFAALALLNAWAMASGYYG